MRHDDYNDRGAFLQDEYSRLDREAEQLYRDYRGAEAMADQLADDCANLESEASQLRGALQECVSAIRDLLDELDYLEKTQAPCIPSLAVIRRLRTLVEQKTLSGTEE